MLTDQIVSFLMFLAEPTIDYKILKNYSEILAYIGENLEIYRKYTGNVPVKFVTCQVAIFKMAVAQKVENSILQQNEIK